MTAEARAEEQTLEEQKQALALELKALPRPILVVIDDIDRLTPPEIKSSLSKSHQANADSRTLTYLSPLSTRATWKEQWTKSSAPMEEIPEETRPSGI